MAFNGSSNTAMHFLAFRVFIALRSRRRVFIYPYGKAYDICACNFLNLADHSGCAV
jgi:hypothetical protein